MDYLDDDVSKLYGINTIYKARPEVEEALKTPDGRGNVQKGPRRIAGTPKGIYSSPSVYTPVPLSESENYGGRTGKGDVVFRYNCSDSTDWSEVKDVKWEVELFKSEDNQHGFLQKDAKFMFQKARDMAVAMNRAIHNLATTIIDENDLEGYQSLKESTTEVAIYVGRVRGDGNGKLTAGSVYFEGTLESSDGHVVSLDLSSLDECFLFPGQVVALGGSNNLGKCVVVKNVFSPRPLPFPEMPLKINRNTGPLNIMIAAGPFTPPDSLSFEAFDDLLEKIKEVKPGVCILLGPFLDDAHAKLDEFVESSREVHHLPVYPTPPYNICNDNNSIIKIGEDIITAVPDPSTISIGGVVIGLTSTDILTHIQENILAHATIHTDRFSRIAREMLSQRSFYPFYPPSENVPLDIDLWTKYAQMECTPHILVLPSKLNPFIKDVDKTVTLNPGKLASGKRTYARLQIEVPDDSLGCVNVADITMGEIVKI
ncbi:unnamed protein product [Allacma fusca]|uniref:DNA polymerase alpha subunit B n=1 Tax=Allacma fusca TaxID=39272 RepID=A0A8J2LND5_9HEXA|nr:unnamed protein product [Allacma fusca]